MKPQHDLGRTLGRTGVRLAQSVVQAADSGLTPDEVHRVLSNLRGVGGFIDPSARVDPSAVVWHFAVVLADVRLGANVSIGAHCEIGRGSVVGPSSRIGSGTFLPPQTLVGERVFIGPHVVMCDDKHPRVPVAGMPSYFAEPPVIEDDAVIGAGAVILPGVRIGHSARVAAGALVTRDVEPFGCVKSAPAREYALSQTAKGKW